MSVYSFRTSGTTKTIIKASTAIITTKIIPGYTIAPRILEIMLESFSSCVASRANAVSSVPDISPADTRERYTSLNTSGCCDNASDNDLPASTLAVTSSITAFIGFDVDCSAAVFSDRDIGKPAPISVANCRVKIIRSFVLTLFLIFAMMLFLSSSSIFSGI